jgi:hypothetical protein
MMSAQGSPQWHREMALRVLDRVRRRTVLGEGMGILRAWRGCDSQQARTQLHDGHGELGQDREARRMIAVVDAAAEGTADPDASWD